MVYEYRVENPASTAKLKMRSIQLQGGRASSMVNRLGEIEVWEHRKFSTTVYVYKPLLA